MATRDDPQPTLSPGAHVDDKRHASKGALTNGITLLGQSSLFLFGTFAARIFGPAVWGAYTTAFAWIDILTRAALAGTDKAVLILVPAKRGLHDQEGMYHTIGTCIRVTLTLAALLSLAMFLLSWPVAALSREALDGMAMRRLAPLVLTAPLITAFLALTLGAKKFRYNLAAKGVVEPVLMLTLVMGLGAYTTSISGLALVPVLVGVVLLLMSVRAVGREFSWGLLARGFSSTVDRRTIAFSIPLAVNDFVLILLHRIPILALIPFSKTSERGIYSSCVLLAATVSFLRGAFDSVFAPVAAEALAAKDYDRLARNLKHQSCMVLFFTVPLASLYIVAGSSILMIYGVAFVRGSLVLGILTLAYAINGAFGLTGWVLAANQQPRVMLRNSAVAMMTNAAMCALLVPRWSGVGAAISTLISVTVVQALHSLSLYKKLKLHLFSKPFAIIFLTGAMVITAEAILLRFTLQGWRYAAFAMVGIGTAIWAGGGWLSQRKPAR